MKEIMRVTDDNDDGMISKAEFMQLLNNKQAVHILKEVGVDVVGLIDYVDTIFETDNFTEELDFSDFVRVILDLRGTNPATVKDIIQLRKNLTGQLAQMEQRLIRMTTRPGSVANHTLTTQACDNPAHMATERKTQWQRGLGYDPGTNGEALNQLIVFHEQELTRVQEQLGELRLHLQQQDFRAQKQGLACSNDLKSGCDIDRGASSRGSNMDSKESGQSVCALLTIASDLATQAEEVLGMHHPHVPLPIPKSTSEGISPILATAPSVTSARSPTHVGSTASGSKQHDKLPPQVVQRTPLRRNHRAWTIESMDGQEQIRPSTCT
jgi:hypothetical protein